MAKVQTNCSIEEFLKQSAKDKGLNLSFELERAIKEKCHPMKKDAPEKCLVLKCSHCENLMSFGFLCRETNKVFCSDCNIEPIRLINGDKTEIFRCHVSRNHEHIRIPGLEGQNIDLLNKVAVEVSNENN